MLQGMFCLLLALGFAPDEPMGIDAARHLLTRAGLGATPEQIRETAALPHGEAVRKLLDGMRTEPFTAAPEWASKKLSEQRVPRNAPAEEKKAAQRRQREMSQELKGWWCGEMIVTDSPLTERLVLFWHNHFTSSLRKVKSPTLLYRQNTLLRRHACGNFRELVHAVARDAAMLVYLDTQRNNRTKPNENFARELLELFTLGEGHYTERDIKEAARAFTGWRARRDDGEFVVVARQHDGGKKTFMGKTGDFDGDDIIDIVLEQPQVSIFITEKLWQHFVSPQPDAAEVARLAKIFRKSSYELRPLLEALLASPHFRDPANRGVLIKSPVDLVIGTVRTLGLQVENPLTAAQATRQLGQDLFDPPNVKGWPGGTEWISSTTLLLRNQMIESVMTGQARRMIVESGMDGARRARQQRLQQLREWYDGLGEDADKRLALARQFLLPVEPLDPPAASSSGVETLKQYLLDPTYQLK